MTVFSKLTLRPWASVMLAVIENLQQDVQHIRMRLFDLVEKDDGVGLAADLLGQLAGLVIADIARGRADDAGDASAFP